MEPIHGDCIEEMSKMPSGVFDAVITDPPYAEVDRHYGYWTADAWHRMMGKVIEQVRRLLKPNGSAMFIIQPNSEKIGRMHPWFFEFIAKYAREWNLIQDVWWWNYNALPTAFATMGGMMRPSLKACVWLGSPDCYRNQDRILWVESEGNKAGRLAARAAGKYQENGVVDETYVPPSGHSMRRDLCYLAAEKRGGVTPFNVLPISNSSNCSGHCAATPLHLCRWWVRYIVPRGGLVLDPFFGSGTTGVACQLEGANCIGIEKQDRTLAVARKRLNGVAK